MPAEQRLFIIDAGNEGHGGPKRQELIKDDYNNLPPGVGCPIRTYDWETIDIARGVPTGGVLPHKALDVGERVYVTRYFRTSFDGLLFFEHHDDLRNSTDGETSSTATPYAIDLTEDLIHDLHAASVQLRWNSRQNLRRHRRETQEALKRSGLEWPKREEEVEPSAPGYADYIGRAVQAGREFHAKFEPFLEYTPVVVTPLTSAPLREAVAVFLAQRNSDEKK